MRDVNDAYREAMYDGWLWKSLQHDQAAFVRDLADKATVAHEVRCIEAAFHLFDQERAAGLPSRFIDYG